MSEVNLLLDDIIAGDSVITEGTGLESIMLVTKQYLYHYVLTFIPRNEIVIECSMST